MRSPLWSVIALITGNIALAAAILLGIFVHWAVGIVALGVLTFVLLLRIVDRRRSGPEGLVRRAEGRPLARHEPRQVAVRA